LAGFRTVRDDLAMPDPARPETPPSVAKLAATIEEGVRSVVGATTRRWHERPGARVRRVRRLGSTPLPFLYDLHPQAVKANPRELGVHTIPVDEIAGTAVGPANQRGGDFLPLKPFRSANWSTRWQRVRAANDRLAILPPIEVGRYAERYWVFDGHNRVAAALYSGQLAVDADVKELVSPDGGRGLPAASLATVLEDRTQVQAAVTRASMPDDSADRSRRAPTSSVPASGVPEPSDAED
jgi:hypothetical protein